MIRQQIPSSYQYDQDNEIFKTLIKSSVKKLLISCLRQLHDCIKIRRSVKLSQSGQKNLKELLRQKNQILNKSEETNELIQALNQILAIYQEIPKQKNNENTKLTESPKHFVLKIVILLLVMQEIVVPELLTLFQFSSQQNSTNHLVFKGHHSVIGLLCQISEIKKYIGILQIDPEKETWNEIEIKQIRNAVKYRFPSFLDHTLYQAVIKALDLILQGTDHYFHEIMAVFTDQIVQELMEQIEKLCGKQLENIIDYKISQEEVQQKFPDSNLIEIGLIYYKIKMRLKKKSEQEKINNEKNKINEKSIYQRQLVKYGVMNPIYYRFIATLVEQRTPFFFLLQTIRVNSDKIERLHPHYRIQVFRDLTCKKKFRKFMQEYYNFEMTKDKALNIQNIMEMNTGKFVTKNQIKWPYLIIQQLQLIYQHREKFKNRLIEFGKTKEFRLICREFLENFESKPGRIMLQKVIRELHEYIQSVSEK